MSDEENALKKESELERTKTVDGLVTASKLEWGSQYGCSNTHECDAHTLEQYSASLGSSATWHVRMLHTICRIAHLVLENVSVFLKEDVGRDMLALAGRRVKGVGDDIFVFVSGAEREAELIEY